MITVLVMVVVMVAAAEAQPFKFTDEVSQYGRHPKSVRGGFGQRKAPANPFPGNGEEVDRWLRLVRPLSTAPSNYVQDHDGPSIYDDYRPPANPQAAASRTLWFDEFPHGRAILNWQQKRIQQGLPVYSLISQRPGFPFYQGN